MLCPTLSYSQIQRYTHCPQLSVTSPQPAVTDAESRDVQIGTAKSAACFGSATKLVRIGWCPLHLGPAFLFSNTFPAAEAATASG